MGTDYLLCPFYEYEKNGVLHCENRSIEFPDRIERIKWLENHCASWDYKICKFYCEQMKKYR